MKQIKVAIGYLAAQPAPQTRKTLINNYNLICELLVTYLSSVARHLCSALIAECGMMTPPSQKAMRGNNAM